VLALDPDNGTALAYLARIAARERRLERMDSLIARALGQGEAGNRAPYLLALRGVLLDDREALDRAVAELRDAGDLRLWTTVWRVLEDTERPAGIRPLLQLLTDSVRSDRMRASGYVALAHAEMARGRWATARPYLAAAEPLDPEMALQARVLFAALPFLPVPRPDVERTRSALLRRGEGVPDAPPGPVAGPEPVRPVRRELRSYQLGLLEARLGNSERALEHARRLDGLVLPADARMPATSLADGIRAQVAWLGGPVPDPLSVLAGAWRERDPKPEVFPYVFGPAHPRFLRAELLRRAGRDREALGWYQSVVEDYDYGIVYAAPVHLRQAEILDRLGWHAEAARHYARFAQLWSDADPSLQPLVTQARKRLEQIR
jgi:tetratricopeptide (TPR) repeat protein